MIWRPQPTSFSHRILECPNPNFRPSFCMSNFIQQLALVSESSKIDLAEVTRVAAALDKQAARDFAPIWNVNSSIHAFERLEDVPLGYWPMSVEDNIGVKGANGIHLDK